MTKAVASGAQLQCSLGTSHSTFQASAAPKVIIEGKVLGSTMDSKPGENIPPFGMCRATNPPVPCIPLLPLPWSSPFISLGVAAAPLLPYEGTIRCAKGGTISIIDCNQASMTIGEPPSPERPHVEPGPTPEERAQMEREEAYARRIWPELADARYGPEPSPEETQAQLEALKDEEHDIRKVLESITQITSDAVENKREAREKAEKVAELKEALNQMRVRETTLRTRLIRINMRNQPRRRR